MTRNDIKPGVILHRRDHRGCRVWRYVGQWSVHYPQMPSNADHGNALSMATRVQRPWLRDAEQLPYVQIDETGSTRRGAASRKTLASWGEEWTP